jgi:hypothetical protein
LSVGASGGSTRATGTEPMGDSAAVGCLGVGQEVSVQAPSQPAVTPPALKGIPMGPSRAHTTRTIHVMTCRRVKRMGVIVL